MRKTENTHCVGNKIKSSKVEWNWMRLLVSKVGGAPSVEEAQQQAERVWNKDKHI